MDRQELINQFFENIYAVKRAMHGSTPTILKDCPISRSQMELLFTLKHVQPTSPKRLGQEMRLSPGAISQTLDGLVEQGFVDRQGNADDRRVQIVQLSKLGTKRLRELIERRNKMMKSILNDLTAEELNVLLKVQTKLADKLSASQESK